MDKYLITLFKPEIATAILNSQEKLNPNKDAYIDQDEIKGVLDFFGVKDVSQLLKSNDSPASSIFQEAEQPQEKPKVDKVEITQLTGDENDALVESGSAANELECRTRADLALATVGTPYAQQMDALLKAKQTQENLGQDVSDIEAKIDALKNLVEDYLRQHPEADTNNLIVKEITYGPNGSKKAILSQSFGVTGNKAFTPSNTPSETETPSSEEIPSSEGSGTDGEVAYNIDFKTLNTPEQGNLHIRGTINAGSDNSDLHAALAYNKRYQNGGLLNLTGNFRQTIENKNNTSSYGASIDYRLNKFSTGGYAMALNKEVDGDSTNTSSLELYGRYGKSIRGSIGRESDGESKYTYGKLVLEGNRDIPSRGLSLTGGVSGEYGVVGLGEAFEGESRPKVLELKARGGITFTSNDFKADISGNITYNKQYFNSDEYGDFRCSNTAASLICNLYTKNIDVSATISSLSYEQNSTMNPDFAYEDFLGDRRNTITSSVKVGIKNIFGKNVMPVLSYNVGNYDGANQNLSVGVIVTP